MIGRLPVFSLRRVRILLVNNFALTWRNEVLGTVLQVTIEFHDPRPRRISHWMIATSDCHVSSPCRLAVDHGFRFISLTWIMEIRVFPCTVMTRNGILSHSINVATKPCNNMDSFQLWRTILNCLLLSTLQLQCQCSCYVVQINVSWHSKHWDIIYVIIIVNFI